MVFYRLAVAVTALAFSVGATAESWEENRREFHAELARQCPGKHLEYMFQSEMLDVFDSFYQTLTPEKRAEFDRASDAEQACADTIAGAGCANGANIELATRLKLLPDFVKYLCSGPAGCPAKGGDGCSEFPQS